MPPSVITLEPSVDAVESAPPQPTPDTPGGVLPGRGSAFEVHLDNFEGPFDLLLGLIAKHKLDVTEIALAEVTDEFLGWIRQRGTDWDLGETSEFLLVAATLLDLKAARLLPAAEVEDDEDLALLEARDLLFARLLQYRAFKDVAATFAQRIAAEATRHPRSTGIEPQFAQLLPELVFGISPEAFAAIAATALRPKPAPTVGLEHLHAPHVSVREQAAMIVDRLRRHGSTSFRTVAADADSTLVVVARFLALLELFREGVVAFDQAAPLGELTIRWTGGDREDVDLERDFDDYGGAEGAAVADNGLAADTGEPTAATDSTDSTDRTDSTETPGAAAGRVDGESAT
ncbi:MAG: segregation/condensation protein A [Kineosporiaceae bacterium]|nr:segregation/condensation protein A [Kineosporiaceae bacterium]MBK7624666.1 segregation/condensation protein A [Kineosporiaceae bacterium]MBK8076960.1 segregation/condensation protein A [Kineosporiaceae bacterium]